MCSQLKVLQTCLLASCCLPVLLQCNNSSTCEEFFFFFAKHDIEFPTKICEHIQHLVKLAETEDPNCVCAFLYASHSRMSKSLFEASILKKLWS